MLAADEKTSQEIQQMSKSKRKKNSYGKFITKELSSLGIN